MTIPKSLKPENFGEDTPQKFYDYYLGKLEGAKTFEEINATWREANEVYRDMKQKAPRELRGALLTQYLRETEDRAALLTARKAQFEDNLELAYIAEFGVLEDKAAKETLEVFAKAEKKAQELLKMFDGVYKVQSEVIAKSGRIYQMGTKHPGIALGIPKTDYWSPFTVFAKTSGSSKDEIALVFASAVIKRVLGG